MCLTHLRTVRSPVAAPCRPARSDLPLPSPHPLNHIGDPFFFTLYGLKSLLEREGVVRTNLDEAVLRAGMLLLLVFEAARRPFIECAK